MVVSNAYLKAQGIQKNTLPDSFDFQGKRVSENPFTKSPAYLLHDLRILEDLI